MREENCTKEHGERGRERKRNSQQISYILKSYLSHSAIIVRGDARKLKTIRQPLDYLDERELRQPPGIRSIMKDNSLAVFLVWFTTQSAAG